MSNAQGFGAPRTVKKRASKLKPIEWQGMPNVELDDQIQLWHAGLLSLRLPEGVEKRSLTSAELEWLDRAAKAEYIASEQNSQAAIFYTSPPPEFCLESADWYLCPDDRWDRVPVLLKTMVERFPAALFVCSASGLPPAFYPDRTPDYSDAQEAIMRSIFRETTRLGWSLPQYKWFVMEQLSKTTAQVTHVEAIRLLGQLQNLKGERDD